MVVFKCNTTKSIIIYLDSEILRNATPHPETQDEVQSQNSINNNRVSNSAPTSLRYSRPETIDINTRCIMVQKRNKYRIKIHKYAKVTFVLGQSI